MSAGFTPPILRACPTSRGCICTPHATLRRHQLLQRQIISRKEKAGQTSMSMSGLATDTYVG